MKILNGKYNQKKDNIISHAYTQPLSHVYALNADIL